jgi:hypothetical protein
LARASPIKDAAAVLLTRTLAAMSVSVVPDLRLQSAIAWATLVTADFFFVMGIYSYAVRVGWVDEKINDEKSMMSWMTSR